MKIAFHTLGCKLNYSETSFILKDFQNNGMKITNFSEEADIYVINTCSVTENANKECEQIVRKVKKISPNSIVAIMGCYAQLKPKKISEYNPSSNYVVFAGRITEEKGIYELIDVWKQFDNKGIKLKIIGKYRKTHLYDALGFKESAKMVAGKTIPLPTKTSVGKLGMIICYDLRFSE